MHVAQTALATLRDQQALAMAGQVADDFIGLDVDHHGSDRHGDGQVFAALAVPLAAHAILAALSAKTALMPEIDESVEVFVGLDPDAAAGPAIAAVGSAQRDEFFAPETNAAVAAVAGGDVDFGFIDEFHGVPLVIDAILTARF